MSSEAAQKAYPAVDVDSIELSELAQEAYDRGAVEALRQTRRMIEFVEIGGEVVRVVRADNITRMADEWEAGR